MNKAEFKAIKMIAEKLDWKSVNFETIKQMVRNQQALELDTVGECDGDEETLLSIAIWDADKIASTMYVNDFESMVMWNVDCFCEDMGINPIDLPDMIFYYSQLESEVFEEQDYEDALYEEYYYETMRDVMWMKKFC